MPETFRTCRIYSDKGVAPKKQDKVRLKAAYAGSSTHYLSVAGMPDDTYTVRPRKDEQAKDYGFEGDGGTITSINPTNVANVWSVTLRVEQPGHENKPVG